LLGLYNWYINVAHRWHSHLTNKYIAIFGRTYIVHGVEKETPNIGRNGRTTEQVADGMYKHKGERAK
jgi:hypothetical protein